MWSAVWRGSWSHGGRRRAGDCLWGRETERWDGREGKISFACSRSAISWQLAAVLFSFEFVDVFPTVSIHLPWSAEFLESFYIHELGLENE